MHHFESHGAFVHHADVTGESGRILGAKPHHVHRQRKGAQLGLHLDVEREAVFLRLVELHVQAAFLRGGARLDVPREHVRAEHGGHVALAAHQQSHPAQLALHHLSVEQHVLLNQPRADGDVRQHLRRVEQLALRLRSRLLP